MLIYFHLKIYFIVYEAEWNFNENCSLSAEQRIAFTSMLYFPLLLAQTKADTLLPWKWIVMQCHISAYKIFSCWWWIYWKISTSQNRMIFYLSEVLFVGEIHDPLVAFYFHLIFNVIWFGYNHLVEMVPVMWDKRYACATVNVIYLCLYIFLYSSLSTVYKNIYF